MDNFRQELADEDQYEEAFGNFLQVAAEKHTEPSLEQYKIWQIHLPTGWTTFYGRRIVLTVKDDEQTLINTIDVETTLTEQLKY